MPTAETRVLLILSSLATVIGSLLILIAQFVHFRGTSSVWDHYKPGTTILILMIIVLLVVAILDAVKPTSLVLAIQPVLGAFVVGAYATILFYPPSHFTGFDDMSNAGSFLILLGTLSVVRAALVAHRTSGGSSSLSETGALTLVPVAVPLSSVTPKPEPTTSHGAESGRTRVCPECAETIQMRARICRHCRYELTPANNQ
jgi:hypothetical protein